MKVPVRIPPGTELLIQTGQNVDFSTPFIKTKKTNRVEVKLANLLQFDPSKIFMFLKKVIGDTVKKGELLAENKSFLSSKQYFSQQDGVIAQIDHNTGSIYLELDSEDAHVVNCFFAGEIELIHDDHIEVKVKNSQQFPIEKVDHYVGSEIYYLPESGQFSEEDIENKYIFTHAVDPLTNIKVEALGAQGYITTGPNGLTNRMKQIILSEERDFHHISENKYPFCIVGLDDESMYFYEI